MSALDWGLVLAGIGALAVLLVVLFGPDPDPDDDPPPPPRPLDEFDRWDR